MDLACGGAAISDQRGPDQCPDSGAQRDGWQ